MPAKFLDNVTLVAVTSVAIAATAEAMRLSQRDLAFADVLFLSDKPPPPGTPAIWRRIAPIGSREAYSHFMLHGLAKHIQTSHVLCIQWDGYALAPDSWDPAFLDYDYIGAPWPHFDEGSRVGNGGFSLRSRHLLDVCATLAITDEAEDVAICRTHRPMLEREFGIRFAPEAIARHFSYERLPRTGHEFGFHGAFNLDHHVPYRDRLRLFSSLEPQLLAKSEHREIFIKAIKHGDLRLAAILWQRMRQRRSQGE